MKYLGTIQDDKDVATKKYVDDNSGGGGGSSSFHVITDSFDDNDPFILCGKSAGIYVFTHSDYQTNINLAYQLDSSLSGVQYLNIGLDRMLIIPVDVPDISDISFVDGDVIAYSSSVGFLTNSSGNETDLAGVYNAVYDSNESSLVSTTFDPASTISRDPYFHVLSHDYSDSTDPLILEDLVPGVYLFSAGTSVQAQALNSSTSYRTLISGNKFVIYNTFLIVVEVPTANTPNDTVLAYFTTTSRSSSNQLQQVLSTVKFSTSTTSNLAAISTQTWSLGYLLSTTAQTINGIKTFNSLPVASGVPTSGTQLTNKTYVDSKITYGTTDIGVGATLDTGVVYLVYEP
jgi:hypothetical protein